MKIKIIVPTFYEVRGELFKTKVATVPNLSLYYLAALVPGHHDVSVIDESVFDIDYDDPVDLVGISVTSFNACRAYEIADSYREKGVAVVLGGIHTTCCQNEASSHADAIVIGEAEDSWPDLIKDFEKGAMKSRYEYPRRESLENLQPPRHDLIDADVHFRIYKQKKPIIPIQTSRGCPHNCDFCAVSRFWGKKMRYRPIKDVIEEVTRSEGEFFFFTDDNFCANKNRSIELCQALKPLKIKYICQIDAISTAKPEVVKSLADSGCFITYIGFESMDADTLQSINKGFNKPAEYEKAISLLNKHDINVFASSIVGFENETYDHIKNTVDFLIKNRVSLAAFYPISPFPGTKLYDTLKVEDKLVDEQWWLKGKKGNEIVDLVKASQGCPTSVNLRYYAFRRFYSLKSIAKRYFIPRKNRLIALMLNLHIRSRIQEEGIFPL